MNTLEDIRKAAERFVRERNWEKFHSCVNILLALCGETGEIAECFQWKGSLDSGVVVQAKEDTHNAQGSFTPDEVVHVGEEVADVLIYLTRLCDVMRLDLAAAVKNRMHMHIHAALGKNGQGPAALSVHMEEGCGCGWSDCSVAELHARTAVQCVHASPRRHSLHLMTAVGKLTKLFGARPEGECSVPCQQWVHVDFSAAADAAAEICMLCTAIANAFGLDVGQAIARKFQRNAVKYPAHAVRGSSAKYTAYVAAATAAAAEASGEGQGKGKGKGEGGGGQGRALLALAAGALLGFLLARGGR